MNSHRTRLIAGLPLVLAIASVAAPPAHAQVADRYRFTYVTTASGLDAELSATVSTSGTLIGVYDAKANPTGTRTKPGLFGSFGGTENLPVDIEDFGIAAEGTLATATSGSFEMAVNLVAGVAGIEAWSVDALATGPIEIPFSVLLFTEAFRTRNPTSTYPAIPLEIPVGSVLVTGLQLVQAGPAVGSVGPAGASSYEVSVTVPASLSLTATVLGQAIEIQDGPIIPVAISGLLTVTDGAATLEATTPISFSQTEAPAEPLPEIPLSLPTLTPEVTADVTATLLLESVGASLVGSLVASATGEPVAPPCPADINGDGEVNGQDLGILLSAWGASAPSPADLNGDGTVDATDLATMLALWGPCG